MLCPDLPDWLARFESGHYRPATFLERGVTLPFTTPSLLGGRIRPADRGLAELVLANPAGSEGVYILPWSAIPDLCAPTLHDRALWSAVAELSPLTPQTVRMAAREVAAQGLAGRGAAQAATTAVASCGQARLILQYRLLLELVRQLEGPGEAGGVPPPERDSPAGVERRALAALGGMRRQGGMAPARALETLGELAGAFEGCGLRSTATESRLPRLAATIAAMAQEVERWAARGSEADRTGARLLVESSDLTLRCCRLAFAEAHSMLDDLWGLVQRWRVAPDEILLRLARPEWLLDGWELICGLWREARQTRRAAALSDMALLVPVIPTEAREWVGFDVAGTMDAHRSGIRRWRRTVRRHEDWISGRLLNQIARNERLRSLCA
jgi:hypothetical protein